VRFESRGEALYFTEQGRNRIGQITPGGVLEEFVVPTDNSTPFGITSALDAALYFTERTGNRIGK
jgi:virginiamycin B lyase